MVMYNPFKPKLAQNQVITELAGSCVEPFWVAVSSSKEVLRESKTKAIGGGGAVIRKNGKACGSIVDFSGRRRLW